MKKSAKPNIPEWTMEQIGLVRRMVRNDHTPTDVARALNEGLPPGAQPITEDAVRARAKKFGMTFTPKRAAYLGTSKLTSDSSESSH